MASPKRVTEAGIACVRDQLDLAIASLVERGPEQTGVGQLREAARLLEEIRQQLQSEEPSRDHVGRVANPRPIGNRPLASPALAAALRGLAPRTARAGQLLDSAAAFYRGWWQVSPAPAEDYTPEGAWASTTARSNAGGNLSLEA